MSSALTSSHFLQEMAYPPYCIQPLKSWGMIAIGGGGGTAKTGVTNAVDLKWIYLNQSSDPTNNKCSIQNVNSFTQHDSVMRMVSLRKQHEYLILALNRQLKVVMLKASHREMDVGLATNGLPASPTHHQDSVPIIPVQRFVRRRHNSSTSSTTDPINMQHRASVVLHRNGQATVEAIGNENMTSASPTSRTPSFSLASATSTITNNIYTVPIHEQHYVNALVVCPATQSKLFVGASDGSLAIYEIIWPAVSSADRLIQLKLLASFKAHEKEIDDLAVDPFGTWLISVSRDYHVQIRQCSPTFDKHSELDLSQFGMTKISKPSNTSKPLYRIRHVRFGLVPSSSSSNAAFFLYTSLIPQAVVDKSASCIIQWTENKQREFIVRQRRMVSYDRISAIAVSNCGQYLSVGDSGGFVRIYETDRLKLLYEHRAHSIFVTDLAFVLREENYLFKTSVLSISADKNLYVHNMSAKTDTLRKNLDAQLERLIDQLADLEQLKDEMDENEYKEARQDTIDQLEEFNKSLEKMKSGDGGLSLLDDVQRIQNAIKSAISEAFQTPEVMRFFAKKEPVQLRNHLAEIERDTKVGKLSGAEGARKKKEILDALRKLGETLTTEEEIYLKQYMESSNTHFAKMNESSDVNVNALSAVAAKQIENARVPR
ncbi:unnamed protein product [Rotaria magnacalcarata]|uniref:Beta-catenin-interacting ICAT domain-containing protein n=3 Tax=Rotaria magnacalcarata TaxID=392030 RepID=A0A819AGX8_9BILA|nr:unnamed protein product [Rotaria magnacalcarata]